MRRADRLFQIVQLLRRSRATTAARLAAELEVSERTIYRDVQDLMGSGVPIQGEAGVGYALPQHFDLPPLMFDAEEIQALVLGARMVEGWADDRLARRARSALAKIEQVLPGRLAARLADARLYVPAFHVDPALRTTLEALREALDQGRVLDVRYRDEAGRRTRRTVRPLGLFYWGRSWTLTAWCELRADFRSFRVDRLEQVVVTERTFAAEPGRTIEDFLARVEAEDARPPTRPVSRRRVARARHGEPAEPDARAARRELQELGSIGPRSADDLVTLGFRRVAELRGQDPAVLYARLCELTGQRHDPCVEDVLRCAIAQAEDPELPAAWRQWHRWTPLRGQPAGALPRELRRRKRR